MKNIEAWVTHQYEGLVLLFEAGDIDLREFLYCVGELEHLLDI